MLGWVCWHRHSRSYLLHGVRKCDGHGEREPLRHSDDNDCDGNDCELDEAVEVLVLVTAIALVDLWVGCVQCEGSGGSNRKGRVRAMVRTMVRAR